MTKTNQKAKAVTGVGLQLGDEGKIKVFLKALQEMPDFNPKAFVRYNGGNNAGHNFYIGEEHLVTHAVPSGIQFTDASLYIGSGCVLNPEKLNIELDQIEEKGFNVRQRLNISPYISLVQPHHVLLDRLTGGAIGTTKNGIGQCYADQSVRKIEDTQKNIRLEDYLSDPDLRDHVARSLMEVLNHHGSLAYQNLVDKDGQSTTTENAMDRFHESTISMQRYVCKDNHFIRDLMASGNDVFFEGANSVMLDPIAGNVPFTTSSRTIASAAFTGGDADPRYHHKTIGVAKAIMSRVGNGPFVSEFGGRVSEEYCAKGLEHCKEAEHARWSDPYELLKSHDKFLIGVALRMIGNEYGATTCRPRRIGMLDLVMLRETCKSNDVDELYLTKVDALALFGKSNLPGIPLVTAYDIDGSRVEQMPGSTNALYRARPIVEFADHIPIDISGMRSWKELPRQAKSFLDQVESAVGRRIYGIGVGPGEDAFIKIR